MTQCEDCGDDCGKDTDNPRRYRCWHCGLLVCGWCWHHVHSCEPDHKKSECHDLMAAPKGD